MHDSATGQVGLLMVVEALLRAGFNVAVPVFDVGYDLIAIRDAKVWRLQVKATARSGVAKSNRVRARRGKGKKSDYTDQHCDALIAVHVVRRRIVCLTLKQLNGRAWISFTDAAEGCPFDALR